MSLKERVKSANLTEPSSKLHKKRRYEKVQTESSQDFHPLQANKVRSYTRDDSKRNKPLHSHAKMIEQNLNLKGFINDLQQQLSLQRGRLEMNKRKTQKYVKQFNREFDKQLYYSGKNPHSYMFSGIKQQYENIKHLYDLKCLEMERQAQAVQSTNIEELSIYIELLEDENCLLKEKLEEVYQLNREHSLNRGNKLDSKIQKHSEIERLYTELDEHEEDSRLTQQQPKQMQYLLKSKSQQLTSHHFKTKLHQCQRQMCELKKKLTFLEKLIIEKGNSEHLARKQSKKLQKDKHEQQLQIKRLREQLVEVASANQKQVKHLLEGQFKKFQIQSDIFRRSLLEKNDHIAKLQKQIRFLSTMLSYWKPLDEIQRNNDFLAIKDPSERDYSDSAKGKPADRIRKQSVASDNHLTYEIIPPNVVQREDQDLRTNREEDLAKRASGARSQSQQNVTAQPRERLPQSCAIKSKSTAKKCRKVETREIKGLGELLRYRLIGNNCSLESIKQLFELNEDCQEEEKEFRTEYITMREVKNILRVAPFYLSEEEATLVSRYVVEDETIEFVYWDEDNQIKRTIAKSIVKALIGDYNLPTIPDVQLEWERLKAQYLPNIQSALKIIAPKGVISQAKFVQLLIGLGIELKDEFKDWLIASMVIQSVSLRELNYRTLIPE